MHKKPINRNTYSSTATLMTQNCPIPLPSLFFLLTLRVHLLTHSKSFRYKFLLFSHINRIHCIRKVGHAISIPDKKLRWSHVFLCWFWIIVTTILKAGNIKETISNCLFIGDHGKPFRTFVTRDSEISDRAAFDLSLPSKASIVVQLMVNGSMTFQLSGMEYSKHRRNFEAIGNEFVCFPWGRGLNSSEND